MSIGLLKAAAALFIGACAVYAWAQYSNTEEQNVHVDTDPLRKRDHNGIGLFEKIRAWRKKNELTNILSVDVTISWLKEQIKECFKDPSVKKVALIAMEKLLQEADSNNDLSAFYEEGATYAMASVDFDGGIRTIKFIKNTGSIDAEIDNLLGEEQMVVITR